MIPAIILGPTTEPVAEFSFYSCRVPAGFPSPAQDHMEQALSLDALLEIDAPHTYLVRAQGHSMEGAGIFDGDELLIWGVVTGSIRRHSHA